MPAMRFRRSMGAMISEGSAFVHADHGWPRWCRQLARVVQHRGNHRVEVQLFDSLHALEQRHDAAHRALGVRAHLALLGSTFTTTR
jgi:hypothetical protein